MRQRLVRLGVARKHREVLNLAEAVAQLLRLAHPAPPEPRPQRLDDLHLIAMHHHALAQFVQLMGAGRPPIVRDQVARPPVVRASPSAMSANESSSSGQRSTRASARSIAAEIRVADGVGEARGLRRGAHVLQLGADRFPGLRRQAVRRRVLLGIGHGVQRGLGVARAGEHPGEIAGLGPPAALLGPRCGSTSRRKARQDFIAARKSCTATASTRFLSSTAVRPAVRMWWAMSRNACPTACCGPNPGFSLMRQLYDGHL